MLIILFSLVVCIKNQQDIISVVFHLYDYLKYSGMLIVFCQNKEILVCLESLLAEEKTSMDSRIHETILREYQVLPLRTHPQMNNKGYSGYVLTAIKIKQQ